MTGRIVARQLVLSTARQSVNVLARQRLCVDCLRRVHTGTSNSLRRQNAIERHSIARLVSTRSSSSRLINSSLTGASRTFASVQDVPRGPLAEYDARVQAGRLKNDEYQRKLIQHLQDLHDMLLDFRPHKVIHPKIEDLQPKKKSWLTSMFGGTPPKIALGIPEDLPKGIYMYGDVGSGKTMMMDLFYDTLPSHIKHKNRVHFHNFMQDVHRRLHRFTMQYGSDTDAIPFVAADIAETSSVLAFDEFQCTDVADAMILRRLIEALMHHGCVIVTTSNRHPEELYKNGVQRQSFIPCINLLQAQLKVLNLDSPTDYRKIPRPPSGVYHHPLDKAAETHAERWFQFFGDFQNDPPHPATQYVWGREIKVPNASGKAARFSFHDLIGSATGAADYIELSKHYEAFIVTDIPGMTYRQRDWARRFITFIDAVYESHAKLVMTTEVPLTQLFMSRDEIQEAMEGARSEATPSSPDKKKIMEREGEDLDDSMRMLMDDLGMNMTTLKSSSIFSGDEERFAFARALSRLSEMGGVEWVERGMGLEHKGGKQEKQEWEKMRQEKLESR